MLLSIEIDSIEPLADGVAFGPTGAWERLSGTAHGEVDPAHPANRGIALLDAAPRNARGCVDYRTAIYLMRPVDPGRGTGRLLYEVNNRGRKLLFSNLADGPAGVNDPRTTADLGNAFPLHLGHTLVWSGWDPGAPRAKGGLALDAPIATRGGHPITQRVRDEFVSQTRSGVLESFSLSHQAASLDPSRARLTVRARQADEPRVLAPHEWAFVDSRTIRLCPPMTPQPGWLHEFHYEATGPRVQGLGFAATRDVVSYLRHDPAALALTGRAMTHTMAIGISQAGRYLRDHIGQGFNRDEQGRRVFDGVLSHTAGAGRVFLNAPFAQPGRTRTQHEDHGFPENEFPFSTAWLADPLTGREGALLRGDATDPLLLETNTSTEYWQKGASLLHTDPAGRRDAVLPANSRVYLIAGTQHGARVGTPGEAGPAVNPRNPHNPMPVLRALMVALDEWVTTGRLPPDSRVPTLADDTLVEADQTGFPVLAGVTQVRFTNRVTPPGDWVDPIPMQQAYGTLVCRVDADGNEVAGIRLPDVAVPLATFTGWNVYRPPFPAGEIADRDGSCLPLAPDAATRLAAADPRPSIAERYADRADYVARVQAVVNDLVRERLLLAQDAQALLERARQEVRVAP